MHVSFWLRKRLYFNYLYYRTKGYYWKTIQFFPQQKNTGVKRVRGYGSFIGYIGSAHNQPHQPKTSTEPLTIGVEQLKLGKKLLVTPNSQFLVHKGVLKNCGGRRSEKEVAIKTCTGKLTKLTEYDNMIVDGNDITNA